MIRVGFYTGKVYSQEDYDNRRIKECCIVANPCLKTEESIKKAKEDANYKKLMNCFECRQCEEAKAVIGV